VLVVAGWPELDRHDAGPGHPERAGRARAALAGIEDAGLGDAVVALEPRRATMDELRLVHDERYLEALRAACEHGGGRLDPDTAVVAGSWDTALLAVGGVLGAVDALHGGEGEAAFVAARPPGHHATAERAMGFCLLNNVAVAAAAVIDWDVHHGNGTQDIFWDDDRVLYVSTHQWPLYPGTGRAQEVGGTKARGTTLNVPLPPGATGDVLLDAFDGVVAEAVESFAPTWVLVSAGFDAHRADPLAQMALTAGDFADLAGRVRQFAPRPGRLVAVLEGGYDLEALRLSVGATVASLMGERYRPEPASAGGPGAEALEQVCRARQAALDE
jgi:acetoin utilization deacetylase AcuC-like enzyme